MADAETDAPEVGTEVGSNAADALMASCTAVEPDPKLTRGEVELVVEDENPIGRHLEETRGLAHGAA